MFNTQNTVQRLKDRSQSILDVFTKTVSDLTLVNQQIEVEEESRQKKIESINLELKSLEETKVSNIKVIDRINSILK